MLRVDLAGRNPRKQIVLCSSQKLLPQHVQCFHRRHDIGDVAMDLQARWLLAGCLADHHGLDEIAHDRHQPLFGVFVAIVAGEEEKLADGDLGIPTIALPSTWQSSPENPPLASP
ncbi:hypothetical protein AAIH46_07020 [Rhizobium sp. 0TCS1.26]|uniref:hypothetical protein n=1 Tax=Rhizobium sp. 0TCS1.26 TaxID=3142623 RepID=UPI003D27D366